MRKPLPSARGFHWGRLLVRDGLARSAELAAITADRLGLPVVELRTANIELDVLSLLPVEIARKYLVLPLRRVEDRLKVALADPLDLQTITDLAARTGHSIEPVLATVEDLQEHIDVSYRRAERHAARSDRKAGGKVMSGTLKGGQPHDVVDLLLQQALQDRASDIHVEPSDSRLSIRFRIDGILHEVMNLPSTMHLPIISRLKIMSGMNIAERRRPQDGQLTFEADNSVVDVRASFNNTVAGEIAVLRILDNKKLTLMNLGQLGMSGQVLQDYRRRLRLPYGMIIVCGPTGSGKSTTLYGSILEMDRIAQKVISIEDPVEYHIPDTNQTQVHSDVGVTFATQLRSILRLDPDVILVGEIRDRETAEIATQAALTGHLVLTSLHANDSVSALLRLRDLGVPPYLAAPSIAGIVAQRMVRQTCQECKISVSRPMAEQEAYFTQMGESKEQFEHGAGCNLCAHTGYYGRQECTSCSTSPIR